VAVYAGGFEPFSRLSEDDGAAQALAQMGTNPSRILFERRSRNTRENVLFARDLVQPVPGQVWLLVVSASDMPRAVAVFRAVNWRVVPYSVGPRTTGEFDFDLDLNVRGRLRATNLAVHEWVGLFAYRLFGWTKEVFPGPNSPASNTR